MKRKFLMTGAAIALLAGMNAASAQMGGGQQGGGQQPGVQNAPSGGTPRGETIKPGIHQNEPGASVQRDQKEKSKVGQEHGPTKEKVGQQGQSKEKLGQGETKEKLGQQPTTTQQNAQGKASTSAVKSVQLSSDQRSKIQTTIKTQHVDRVRNPDFDVRVGVHVPRTVRIVPLPIEIVEIVPQYRGYDYVLVGDELLIIDPVTLEIVTILPA